MFNKTMGLMRIYDAIKGLAMLGAAVILFSTSCTKDPEGDTIEEIMIREFLVERNITTEPTATGLYYIEELAGTGDFPAVSDTVEVIYKGMFLDGRVFDSNIGKDLFSFPLGEGKVIKGWDEGVSYMKLGGKAKLLIPSSLAYGPYGQGSIPGYTPLLFEIEIVNIRFGPNHVVK